jgi:hypothetical protein
MTGWQIAWAFVIASWWVANLVGLIVSVASLRVALTFRHLQLERRRNGPNPLRVATGRTIMYAALFIDAPNVYILFRPNRTTGLSDRVLTGGPFALIFFSAMVLAGAIVAVVVLAFLDLRDMRRQAGEPR